MRDYIRKQAAAHLRAVRFAQCMGERASISGRARPMNKDERDACAARCLREWDSVRDPPCHPADTDWQPCPLCLRDTEDNA